MKFCFSCHQLSSSRDLTGESLFCPHCGLSFGVRRCRSCKKKPSSPLDSQYCVHCGGQKLSEATSYLEMGWLVKILTLGVGFLAVRWLWNHLAGVVSPATKGGATSVSALLLPLLDRILFWLLFFGFWYVILSLVPGTEPLRKLMVDALRAVCKTVASFLTQILNLLYKLLVRVIEGNKT